MLFSINTYSPKKKKKKNSDRKPPAEFVLIAMYSSKHIAYIKFYYW